MTLNDKNVLITGGTGQLGQVVAQTFVAAGSRVASSYLEEKELGSLTEGLRKTIFLVRGDVTNEQEVAALFQQVTKKFGHLDVLINLVGGFVPKREVRETTAKTWSHMMNINLQSTFLCCREFLKTGKGRTYGRIISMAAMPALQPAAGRAPYAVSKAGVVVLTTVLGEELKGSGITANAIAPSIIKTAPNMESMPKEDFSKWVTPREIASVMMFLCSDDARSINGLTIPMFGGV